MTAPEMKPCPFCGSEVEIKREPKIGWIKCTDPNSACIGSGLGFAFIIADEETAIVAWNTRPASIPAPGANYVAGLEAALRWHATDTSSQGDKARAALSARPIDTRVVTVGQLERWGVYAEDGLVATPIKEIRAIIGGQANA
jgi:hypothetical protein